MRRAPFTIWLLPVVLAVPLVAQGGWTELGPSPILSGPYTGRVAAVATSATDGNVYYVGGADGGVWRTSDGGASWTAIGDRLPTTAVGAVAVDPTDHDVVYVGTGEGNFANHSRYGLGLMRSRDGGQTWSQHGVAEFAGRCFARIAIDPKSTGTLYAATTHAGGFPPRVAAFGHPLAVGPIGIWKSIDFGTTWTQLRGGLPGDVSATDVAIDPQSTNIVYAAIADVFGDPRNGVYRSTDAGTTWTRLQGGLPTAGVGRITLAIAPSRPSTLYAAVAHAANASGGNAGTLNVFRSDDGGATWHATNPGSYQATYGWYLSTAIVGRSDPDVVLVGGLELRRSTNGGSSWSTVTPPHVDLHALAFDANGRLLCGDDGGLHRSGDLGSSWSTRDAGLGLIQLYAGVSFDPTDPDRFWAGAQDNGSVQRDRSGWVSVLGGDGGPTSVDSNGTRVFVEYQGTGNLFRSINGGALRQIGNGISGRNCFLPPHQIHPSDPMLAVYGTERVFRTTDGGTSWQAISPDLTAGGGAAICGLQMAPSDPQVVYALTNDGRVQVTTDGGQTWRLSRTGVPTWPRSRRPFAIDPTDPLQVWLAVQAFGVDRVLHSTDGGRTWTAVDGDLPDVPVHSVAVDARSSTPVLYAGTDHGVYRSDDGGGHWRVYGWALPNAAVVDLRADVAHGRLLAATQGRGLWQDVLLPAGAVLTRPVR